VGLLKNRIDQLAGETDADACELGREGAEEAVVVPAAAAEARASGGKGESGNEDNFRTGGVDGWTFGRVGFEEAERARFQLRKGLHSVEHQVVSHDAGEEDGFRPAPIERAQIGFAGQRGKGGDSLCRLPVGQ